MNARIGQAQTSQSAQSEKLGRFMAEVHPLGVELDFTDKSYSQAIFKLGLAFAGKIAEPGNISVWLGGELNIGGIANLAKIEPGLFVKLTFEKLVPFRLVPFFRAGIVGGIDVPYGVGAIATPYGVATVNTGGDIGVEIGGGAHYFVTRNIGIGLETDLQFGGHFQSGSLDGQFQGVAFGVNVSGSGFIGYWDLLAGAVFTF
jgi:hypothetical protein